MKTNKKELFKGVCTALITPFKDEKIDYHSLKNLIEFQINSGIDALLVNGTTGESATLTECEKRELISFTVREVAGRVPLIAGTGSNSTTRALHLSQFASDVGADAILVVTPYYNKTNQTGLIAHYKAIAKNTKLPIILYNVPSRTGVNILPETVIKLAKINNIVGIKEASGNLSQIAEICKKSPKSFAVYSGDDLLTLPILSMGAHGVISVTANAEPEKVQMLCNFAKNQDFFNARHIHEMLFELNKALFLDVNPICIKEYLNLIGFNVGRPRLPLTEANQSIKKQLKEVKKFYEN
jgi:4-hydroxy-tetrahydrodipicolinate synthase